MSQDPEIEELAQQMGADIAAAALESVQACREGRSLVIEERAQRIMDDWEEDGLRLLAEYQAHLLAMFTPAEYRDGEGVPVLASIVPIPTAKALPARVAFYLAEHGEPRGVGRAEVKGVEAWLHEIVELCQELVRRACEVHGGIREMDCNLTADVLGPDHEIKMVVFMIWLLTNAAALATPPLRNGA